MMINVHTKEKQVSIWESGKRICVLDLNEPLPVSIYTDGYQNGTIKVKYD